MTRVFPQKCTSSMRILHLSHFQSLYSGTHLDSPSNYRSQLDSMNMSDLESQFREAADAVKRLKSRPSDGELLELYALFKQATIGDNKESKPGMFQLKEKAKHESWLAKKGTSQLEAKKAYISRVKSIVEALGTD